MFVNGEKPIKYNYEIDTTQSTLGYRNHVIFYFLFLVSVFNNTIFNDSLTSIALPRDRITLCEAANRQNIHLSKRLKLKYAENVETRANLWQATRNRPLRRLSSENRAFCLGYLGQIRFSLLRLVASIQAINCSIIHQSDRDAR